jgi:flagellar biosynthesis protein FlhF
MAAQLSGIIAGLLGKPDTIQDKSNGKPVTVIFVGPTGVGKTTTLAKIAANYLLNRKKTVGLITADTYRIAAVEQLKTYAEILGIPVSVAYTPAEMKEAVSLHSDKDLILIDTAGRSHKNKAQFEELKALIAASAADEVYLVLSATTSQRNCREILNSYSFLSDYKLLFTKADETPVLGIILNVRYMTGKSLSYITTGQSVPDDIETANIDKITKNLMGSCTR